MTQYMLPTIDPNTHTGTQLADFLNQWAQAVISLHSGAARPTYATRGMLWTDIGASGATILNFFDGTLDREIGRVENGAWRPAGAVSSGGGSIGGDVTVARRVTVTPYNATAQIGGQMLLQNGGGVGGDLIIEKTGDNARIYTSPTAVLSMNASTGIVTMVGALISGAQRSEVNALTRKDYVDAQIATRLPLAGGNAMGRFLGVYNQTAETGASLHLTNHNVREWYLQNTGVVGDYGNFRIVDATAGFERFRIDTLGRVALGGATPTGQLTITSPNDRSTLSLWRQDGVPSLDFNGNARLWKIYPASDALNFQNANLGETIFAAYDGGAWTKGNFTLWNSTTYTGTLLTLYNDSGYYYVQSLAGASGQGLYIGHTQGLCAQLWPKWSNNRFIFLLGPNNEGGMYGTNNGNVSLLWNGAVMWSAGVTASDGRLKKVFGATKQDAAAIVQKLAVKEFEYTDPAIRERVPGRRIGFVAQDVQQVFPQAVHAVAAPSPDLHRPALDDDAPLPDAPDAAPLEAEAPLHGGPHSRAARGVRKGYRLPDRTREVLQVSKDEMVPVLWRALQQALERIEDLEADIEDLRLRQKAPGKRGG